MSAFSLAIFLGSYLLFFIQPFIGKYILPWYGGTPNVWMACLLFFQSMLLFGYTYAHLLTLWFRPKQQALIHISLIFIVCLLLPVAPSSAWKGFSTQNPTWAILAMLITTVGAPFFVLSASAPLLQKWFSLTHRTQFPYRLYALSNLASLGALISYPFVVERLLSLSMQSFLWSGIFLLYGITISFCARQLVASNKNNEDPSASHKKNRNEKPLHLDQILWVVLSACGTLLLMATTSQITQEVAPIPLLWVIPLAIYLLTFVICFDHPKWYYKELFVFLFVGTLCMRMALFLVPSLYSFVIHNMAVDIFIYLLVLFSGCMCCQGELVKRRPIVDYLTQYYLLISLGGALGGCFIVLGAPNIFNDYREYFLSILWMILSLLISGQFQTLAPKLQKFGIWKLSTTTVASFMLIAIGFGRWNVHSKELIAANRNFYGPLRVFDVEAEQPIDRIRTMVHGSTIHGAQYESPERRQIPISYYDRKGVGLAIEAHPKRLNGQPMKFGVIGLGGGILAAYAKKNDTFVFYEINPLVIEYCLDHFTFVKDAKTRGASIDILVGDGRLELEKKSNRESGYDVLIVDAFSSDSIPVHLLTSECLDAYWRQLAPGGVLAFHISNRYLDLRPVIYRHAADKHAIALNIQRTLNSDETNSPAHTASNWVFVTSNTDLANRLTTSEYLEAFHLDSAFESWSDDFNSLIHVLR